MMSKNQKLVGLRGVVGCCVVLLIAGTCSAQNLVVQWTFDEAAGGTVDALDTGVAPATTGVLGSTATRTADTPGGGPGFALDVSVAGADTSIVNGGNPLEVDTLAQFTLSTWAKVTSLTDYNEGGSGNVRLVAKQSGGLFDGFSWNMNLPQQGEPRSQDAFTMGLFVGGDTAFGGDFASEDILDRGGDWLFLAVTYDGNSTTNNTKFWIGDENNAVTQLGIDVTINSGPVFSTNTGNGGFANAEFGVGFTDAAPGNDFALSGLQDDVRVYDGVLAEAALDAVRLENLPAATSVDLDVDNDVDGRDLLLIQRTDPSLTAQWEDEFGNGVGPVGGGSAVPEPTTMALVSIASLGGLFLRRRR